MVCLGLRKDEVRRVYLCTDCGQTYTPYNLAPADFDLRWRVWLMQATIWQWKHSPLQPNGHVIYRRRA
jgi:hypothetical protein